MPDDSNGRKGLVTNTCLTCSGLQPPVSADRCERCEAFEHALIAYLVRGGVPAEYATLVTVNRVASERAEPLRRDVDTDDEYEAFSIAEIRCGAHDDVFKQTVEDTVLVSASREGIELCADVVMLTPTQARVLIESLERAISKTESLFGRFEEGSERKR